MKPAPAGGGRPHNMRGINGWSALTLLRLRGKEWRQRVSITNNKQNKPQRIQTSKAHKNCFRMKQPSRALHQHFLAYNTLLSLLVLDFNIGFIQINPGKQVIDCTQSAVLQMLWSKGWAKYSDLLQGVHALFSGCCSKTNNLHNLPKIRPKAKTLQ